MGTLVLGKYSKIFLVIVGVFLPISVGSQTSTSQTSLAGENVIYENLNPHIRLLKRNLSFKGVEFLNRDGKVKYQFPRKVKVDKYGLDSAGRKVFPTEIFFNGKHHVESFDPDEKEYFLINEPTINYRGKKVGIKKWENVDANHIYVFNSDGNLIFSKTNAPYCLESISANGKYLVCTRLISVCDDNVDPNGNQDAENEMTPSEVIYVYSIDGKKLYEVDLESETGYPISLSPSGDWLTYCDHGQMALNIQKKISYKLPIDPGYMGHILDDGNYTSSSGQTIQFKPSSP